MTDEAARAAQRARAERHRDRKRDGRTLVSIEVTWRQRQALLRLGLIAVGTEGDPEAVARAASRFLEAAESVLAMGQALYPSFEEFFPEEPDEPVSDAVTC